ncbi:unnamed protein product [Staurois parvus]|uniref:Serpin domain-containing protein n=1 Tax=Staurois parvus TaxID=386267 RepID=A0ABN9GJ37_9NEOB|nr:unnamed protein product [Staurois parvus]
MRVLLYLGFSLLLLCLTVFADHEGKKHDHEDDHEKKDDHDHKHHDHAERILPIQKVQAGNKKFAFDLYGKVATDHPEKNIAMSPISISVAMVFLSLGAKDKTHDQIVEGIRFNISEISETEMNDGFHDLQEKLNADDREVHLNSGNGLFVSEVCKVNDDFLNKAKNLRSGVSTVNFEENEEVKKQINSYVEKNTNGKIVDVLSSVDKDAALVLVNFIYFNGTWEKPFDEKFTKEGDFHVNKDLTVKVPFMSQTGYYMTGALDEADIVSVPYKGNASMLFIQPKDGQMKGVESHLTDVLKKFQTRLYKDLVDLRIPKFDISGDIDLKQVLPKLGIVDMFSNEANLSGITGTPNLKISQALHKAKINVHEKGTEAAGATVMEAIPMRLPTQITLNYPFVFIIFDHDLKTILFMGKVVNPSE